MVGLAVSRFGLSAENFYDLTPIEFRYALVNLNDKDEYEFKTKYEVARFLAKHIWNSAGKSVKHFIREAKDIETFSWEADDILEQVQTIDQMKSTLLSIAAGKIVRSKKKSKKKGTE